MIEQLTCKSCRFFEPLRGHPQGIGNCCVNPPTAVPTMGNVGPVVGARVPQPMTLGIDPPVAPTRRACRHYSRDFMDA